MVGLIIFMFFVAFIIVAMRIIVTVQYWINDVKDDLEEDETMQRIDAALERKIDRFKENLLAKLEK